MTKVNAKLDKWDPLKQSISEEVLGATIKREIKNILKSYMRNKLNEKDYIPGIWIKIDMHDNLICVTDNGIGFKETEFKNFLAPNVSFKRGDTRGNKGVGATYLGYGFNFLQIGTKTDDFKFIGTLKGGENGLKMNPILKQDQKFKKIRLQFMMHLMKLIRVLHLF